jgi:pimeloyl-ACP methyl ester carboxylesterase
MIRRRAIGLALALTAAALPLATPATAQARLNCRSVTAHATMTGIPVSVHGRLCTSATTDPNTIELLVPGATYRGDYYDAPGQSFQDQEGAQDLATLAIDRVGTGASTQPPAALVTGVGQASVLHQIIGQLHSGALTGHATPRVVELGHSLGSLIVLIEAATYHDPSAVVITGIAHTLAPPTALADFLGALSPAPADPKFAGTITDPLELTTAPGEREGIFDDPADISPALVAYDEKTLKDITPEGELPDATALGFSPTTSLAINVPTLVALGQHDVLLCVPTSVCTSAATLAANEAIDYAPAAHLRTFILAGSGHSIALATNSNTFATFLASWVRNPLG